ncbi:hypothetical protein ABW19_dt0206899 [Dactylella cylindrospora]|nr:hypothetical protein ABW19_dt0206899 [Dactylella cylindrospora]
MLTRCVFSSGIKSTVENSTETSSNTTNMLTDIYNNTYSYEAYLMSIPDRFTGTGDWLLKNPAYESFRDSGTLRILWVTANAGCGKTVLSKAVIEDLRMQPNVAVCYFFFKAGNRNQSSWVHALCTFLYQILSAQKKLCQVLGGEHDIKGEGLFNEEISAWASLKSVSLSSQNPWKRIYCVLDGVDESPTSTQTALTHYLKQLVVDENKDIGLRFLVTSRPNLHPQTKLFLHRQGTSGSGGATSSILRISGECETASLRADINKAVDLYVANLQEMYPRMSGGESLANSLKSQSGPSFLWVSLIYKILSSPDTYSMARTSIQRALEAIPQDLKLLYRFALASSANITDTRRILSIILAAKRPLKLQEVNAALQIRPDHKSLGQLKMDLEPDIEFTTRKLCGIFVHIAHQTVFLIHETAREFLMEFESYEDPPWAPLRLREAHDTLAESCITYLMMPDWEDDSNLLADYAASNWQDHELESRRVANHPSKRILKCYDLETPRPRDERVRELCDEASGKTKYWVFRGTCGYSANFMLSAIQRRWIPAIIHIIQKFNSLNTMPCTDPRGIDIWGYTSVALQTVFETKNTLLPELFFKFLHKDLMQRYLNYLLDNYARIRIGYDEVSKEAIEMVVNSFAEWKEKPHGGIFQTLAIDLAETRLPEYLWYYLYGMELEVNRGQLSAVLEAVLMETCYRGWADLTIRILGLWMPEKRFPYRRAIQTALLRQRDVEGFSGELDAVFDRLEQEDSSLYRCLLEEFKREAVLAGDYRFFWFLPRHRPNLCDRDASLAFQRAVDLEWVISASYFYHWPRDILWVMSNLQGSMRSWFQKYRLRRQWKSTDTDRIFELKRISILLDLFRRYLANIHPASGMIDRILMGTTFETISTCLEVIGHRLTRYLGSGRICMFKEYRPSGLRDLLLWQLGQASRGSELYELLMHRGIRKIHRLRETFETGLFTELITRGALILRDLTTLEVELSEVLNTRNAQSLLVSAIFQDHPHTEYLLSTLSSVIKQSPQDFSVLLVLSCWLSPQLVLKTKIADRLSLKEAEERQPFGITPLVAAVWSGDFALTENLLSLGANPNIRPHLPSSVHAPFGGILFIDEFFLKLTSAGPYSLLSSEYLNPLLASLHCQSDPILGLLLSYQADPWLAPSILKQDFKYISAFQSANQYRLLSRLVIGEDARCRWNLDQQEEYSLRTILHYAALSNDSALISQLLSQHASPAIEDAEGQTALHLAASQSSYCWDMAIFTNLCFAEIVDWSTKKDKHGRTPLQVALKNRCQLKDFSWQQEENKVLNLLEFAEKSGAPADPSVVLDYYNRCLEEKEVCEDTDMPVDEWMLSDGDFDIDEEDEEDEDDGDFDMGKDADADGEPALVI